MFACEVPPNFCESKPYQYNHFTHVFSTQTNWTAKLKSPTEIIGMKRLALMAVDVLSPPPMSDEPERIFSSAGATLGKRRTSLDPSCLEAIECLKAWVKAGLGSFIEGGTNNVTLNDLERFLKELDEGTVSSIEKHSFNEMGA